MGKSTVKEVLVKAGHGKGRKNKGGGAKKIGRNLAKCAKYKALGTLEKNKARKAKTQAHKEEKKTAKLADRREEKWA